MPKADDPAMLMASWREKVAAGTPPMAAVSRVLDEAGVMGAQERGRIIESLPLEGWPPREVADAKRS